jgi:hypothetical protein
LAGYGYFSHVTNTKLDNANIGFGQQDKARMQIFLKQRAAQFTLHGDLLRAK